MRYILIRVENGYAGIVESYVTIAAAWHGWKAWTNQTMSMAPGEGNVSAASNLLDEIDLFWITSDDEGQEVSYTLTRALIS